MVMAAQLQASDRGGTLTHLPPELLSSTSSADFFPQNLYLPEEKPLIHHRFFQIWSILKFHKAMVLGSVGQADRVRHWRIIKAHVLEGNGRTD